MAGDISIHTKSSPDHVCKSHKKSIFSTFFSMAGDISNAKNTPKALKGRFAAVLPAGGLGKRMGGNIPKQLMLLGGKPVYRYSLETFLEMEEIAEVVMAVPADWKDHFEKEIFSHPKLKIVVGGAERWQSVENGVNALTSSAEYVLVHDVARPFISEEIIRNVCNTLVEKGSCLVAKPAVDTIKIAKTGASNPPSTAIPSGWHRPRRPPPSRY